MPSPDLLNPLKNKKLSLIYKLSLSYHQNRAFLHFMTFPASTHFFHPLTLLLILCFVAIIDTVIDAN